MQHINTGGNSPQSAAAEAPLSPSPAKCKLLTFMLITCNCVVAIAEYTEYYKVASREHQKVDLLEERLVVTVKAFSGPYV